MRHSILGLVVCPVLALTATPVFAEAADILDRYKATMEILVGDVPIQKQIARRFSTVLMETGLRSAHCGQPKSTQQSLICFANLRVLEE